MKLKGINPIEQHLEWIVLSVVGVVFLGVLAMQFLLSPNTVTIDNQPYPPQDAFKPVEARAQEVSAQLKAPTVALPELDEVDLEALFQQEIEDSSLPRRTILAFGGSTTIASEQLNRAGPGADAGRIAELTPPSPSSPLVAANRSTIDPYAVSSFDGLADVLPAQQPFDKASVTIQTSFDGTQLRRALLAEQEDARPMPPMWWNQSMGILGVEVEREELGLDGSWGGSTIISNPPGAVDVQEALAGVRGFQELQEVVESLRGLSPQIQRPSYYPVIAGPAWVTPSEALEASALELVRSDAERLLRLIDEATVEKEALEEELGPEPDASDVAAMRRYRQAKRPIDRLEKEIADRTAELEAMGVDAEVGLPEQPEHDPYAFEPENRLLLNTPEVPLWTHDMTVESGKTYRYRVRVQLSNPAFGRGEALPEDQQAMAESPVMPTAWSIWSEPVLVPAETMYFLTSASSGDGLGMNAGATAEVFKFFYGYWRQGRVTLDPGDVIAKDLELPDAELMPIYEVAEDGSRDEEPDPGPTSLTGAVDAFMLGVSETAGQDNRLGGPRSRFEVYIRNASGVVETRRPSQETQGTLYQRLKRSAEIGRRQGIPEPVEEVTRPTRPVRVPRDEREWEPDGKSGGGGGGGG